MSEAASGPVFAAHSMPATHSAAVRLCRSEARLLSAYNAGVREEVVKAKYGLTRVTKLASNENPLGASPQATAAVAGWLGQLHRYPDPTCAALRQALQAARGIDAGRILVGNGSEDIIESACKAVLAPGDRVVTLAPSFGLHEIFPRMMGATVDKVPVGKTFEFDLAAWRVALARPAKLVIFSTPSNPVGCILSGRQLEALIGACPEDSLLVVDEAYHEYAAGPDYPDSLELLAAQSRPWIVLRTFSKAYGLAGLRIGYGVASDAELVSVLDRVRTPFNVNGAAQAAALAAMSDAAHLQAVVRANACERAALAARLAALEGSRQQGLRTTPSKGNFLFIDTARPGWKVSDALMRRGVIVKPWLEQGFDSFIRVSVGRPEESEHFLLSLEEVLDEVPRERWA